QWQPEALPATRKVREVEATLDLVTTGHGGSTTRYGLEHGGYAVEFATNRADGRNETFCRIHLRPLTDTSQVWQVDQVEMSDAAGNTPRSMGMTWTGPDLVGFSPGLWTNEAAWKLRFVIKRTQGFAPGELMVFKNVPLG